MLWTEAGHLGLEDNDNDDDDNGDGDSDDCGGEEGKDNSPGALKIFPKTWLPRKNDAVSC